MQRADAFCEDPRTNGTVGVAEDRPGVDHRIPVLVLLALVVEPRCVLSREPIFAWPSLTVTLGAAVDFGQLMPLTWDAFRRRYLVRTSRPQLEIAALQPFTYAAHYSYYLFYAAVTLTFGALQPLAPRRHRPVFRPRLFCEEVHAYLHLRHQERVRWDVLAVAVRSHAKQRIPRQHRRGLARGRSRAFGTELGDAGRHRSAARTASRLR